MVAFEMVRQKGVRNSATELVLWEPCDRGAYSPNDELPPDCPHWSRGRLFGLALLKHVLELLSRVFAIPTVAEIHPTVVPMFLQIPAKLEQILQPS